MSTYFLVLWKRLPLILISTIVAVAVAYAVSTLLPQKHTAEAEILVTPAGLNQPDYGTYLYFEQLTNTFTAILESAAVNDKAIELLEVEELPNFSIKVIPNSQLLQIAVHDENPQLAENAADTLANLIIDNVQSQYSINVSNIRDTLGRLVKQSETDIQALVTEQAELSLIAEGSVRVAELERLIGTRQDAYRDLLSSYNQALVAATSQASLASILAPASVSPLPTSPRVWLILIAGALSGLLGGIALAFIREGAEPRLYTADQVEAATNAPIMGKIPKLNLNKPGGLAKNDFAASQAFKRLRTTVLERLGTESGSLLITSPEPGQGSSFTAQKLATSLARSHYKTVLVDANFARPSVHDVFKLSNKRGLSNALIDSGSPVGNVQTSPVPYLDVLATGSETEAATELLGSERMACLLETLRSTYDMVVFDSPPVLALADAPMVARLVDGVILVVEKNAERNATMKAFEELSGSTVLGTVLNRQTADGGAAWIKKY